MTTDMRDEIDDEVCALMMDHGPDGHVDGHDVITDMVMRRIAEQVAAERERCAKLCEESNVYEEYDPGKFFADLIRKA